MITSGGFDRHLRLVRARQRQRRDVLLRALARHLPQARVQGMAAGLHLLVTLPELTTTARWPPPPASRAWPCTHCPGTAPGPGPPGLVIGYAATTPDRLREAVRRLAPLVG